MPMSVSLCVCVWERGSSLWWGEGNPSALSPGTDWLVLSPRGVLAVFVLRGIKTSLPGNTRGIVTYTKTPSRTTSSSLCLAHTSISANVFAQSPCAHAHTYHRHISPIDNQQASSQCKLTAEGDDHGRKRFMNMESRCRSSSICK